MCLPVSLNAEVKFSRTLRSSHYQNGFSGMFMKFRGLVNIRKFLAFFINYQVKFFFFKKKLSGARSRLIISFMCWSISIFSTGVIMILAQFFFENKYKTSLTNKCNVLISFTVFPLISTHGAY